MDKAINCLIVDDEPIARQGMETLIRKVHGLKLLGHCKSAVEAEEMIKQQPVELIFLDIEMPGVNGLEFAASLKNVLVIFTTAYGQYALDSYAVDAVDYLVKPIHEDRFFKAVNKALMFRSYLSDEFEKSRYEYNEDEALVIRADLKLHKIKFNDIRYIEGLKDYVIIYLRSGRLVTAVNLKHIHLKLPNTVFKRINKSYIVNIDFITAVGNRLVYLNEDELPMGSVYRKDFLKEYLGKPH